MKVQWKKLYCRLVKTVCFIARVKCKELQQSLKGRGTDSDVQNHSLSEAGKWKSIMKRLQSAFHEKVPAGVGCSGGVWRDSLLLDGLKACYWWKTV
jgi:hypothetical protein